MRSPPFAVVVPLFALSSLAPPVAAQAPAGATVEVINDGPDAIAFDVEVAGKKVQGQLSAPAGKTTRFAVPAGVGAWKALGEGVVPADPAEFGLDAGGVLRLRCEMVSRIMTGCDFAAPSVPEGEVAAYLRLLNDAARKRSANGLKFVVKLPLSITTGGEGNAKLTLRTGDDLAKYADLLRMDPRFVTAASMGPAAVGAGEPACSGASPVVDWSKGGKSITRTGDSAKVTFVSGACGQFQHKVVLGLSKVKSSWQLVSHTRSF